MKLRTTPGSVLAQLLVAVTMGTIAWAGLTVPTPASFELELRSSAGTMVRMSQSSGGEIGPNSFNRRADSNDGWLHLRFDLASGPFDAIRVVLAPKSDEVVSIRDLRIVSRNRARTMTIDTDRLREPDGSMMSGGLDGERRVTLTAGRPLSLRLPLEPGERMLDPPAPWASIALASAICWLFVLVASTLLDSPAMTAVLRVARRHRASIVVLAAILATCASCWEVVFDGKSFVSPRNGMPGLESVLPHDKPLTLSGLLDDRTEDVHEGDVGAMMLHHLPYSFQQEQSLRRFGEFPLWNRFNAAGQSMAAQGQAMLGDPLNWMLWFVGVDARAYDAKFVVLRVAFASALGLSVLLLTRSLFASVLVAIAAPFIGEFAFRINHPAIFTLCWSSVLLLSWIRLAEAPPRRIWRELLLVVVANWLMLNSGTVKEAYVGTFLLDAIGALHAGRAALRGGPTRSIRLIAVLAAGPLALLIGTPVWAPLLDAVMNGWSAYGEPVVMQLPLYETAGFADNFFFLVSDGVYEPGVNALLFVGAVAAVFALRTRESEPTQSREMQKILTLAVAACLAMAFGLVPAALLLRVPLLKSVHHIHNTFLTVSITPVCVLAGIGFAQARQGVRFGSWRTGWAALATLMVLIPLDIVLRPVDHLLASILFGTALVASSAVLVWWLARRRPFSLSAAQFGALSIAFLLVLGRGAQWGDVSFENYVFNPKERVDFAVDPPVIHESRAAFSEPVRIAVSSGLPLFSGYQMMLGLESIDGPEALEERPYRMLMEALRIPYDGAWRTNFSGEALARHRGALDMLGVGLVFSLDPLAPADDLREITRDPPLFVYARKTPWPRAFFASGVRTYASIDDVAVLADRESSPFVAVPQDAATADPAIGHLIGTAGTIIRARDYVLTNNSTSFTIDAPSAGVAYLGESDEAGSFKAYLDGNETAYFRANGAFKALLVPRGGTWRVKVEFWPRGLTADLIASAVGLMLLMAVAVHLRRRAVEIT